jgi:hypothetical protein
MRRYRAMFNDSNQQLDPGLPAIYQFRLRGELNQQWSDWFVGLTIAVDENGDTLITGPVVDQSALHGILRKIRDLGMPLISVMHIERDAPEIHN